VVGEVNRGWYYLAVALDFERSGIQSFAYNRRHIERMASLIQAQPALVTHHRAIRNEIAERAIEVTAGTLLAYRVATMQARGEVPNYEASTSKLFGSELTQRVNGTAMHLLGMVGQLRDGSKYAPYDEASAYMEAVSATIAAGTSEIQRGIIATRGLGLPR
jgi:alkylation response protein AidB-like acyl-CoA dehydrogenase